MAMRPRSSPLYAFATSSPSENDPTMRPCLIEHSRTKAAKHRLGYISWMYNPSVTATSEPSAIESCSQVSPPVTLRCSHSHVFPHKRRMPRKDEGAWLTVASGLEDVRHQHSLPRVNSTKQMVLRWLLGWMCEWWNLFDFLPVTNTSSMAPSALSRIPSPSPDPVGWPHESSHTRTAAPTWADQQHCSLPYLKVLICGMLVRPRHVQPCLP